MLERPIHASLGNIGYQRLVIKLFGTHRLLINAQQPPLQQRYDSMHRGIATCAAPQIEEKTGYLALWGPVSFLLQEVDDDQVLACALTAKAQLIVSGDSDLLSLGEYQGIRIAGLAHAVSFAPGQKFDGRPLCSYRCTDSTGLVPTSGEVGLALPGIEHLGAGFPIDLGDLMVAQLEGVLPGNGVDDAPRALDLTDRHVDPDILQDIWQLPEEVRDVL